jgi:hypothetical protein
MAYRYRAAMVVWLVLTASLAHSQDDPGKTAKPAEKKKPEAKKVMVQVKVTASDGKPLPAGLTVEISGQEAACGSLNSTDARTTVDEKGKGMFPDLPACKVTVKINLNQYLPVRRVVDLAGYKSCTTAAPGKNGAAPGCEAVALVLDPL